MTPEEENKGVKEVKSEETEERKEETNVKEVLEDKDRLPFANARVVSLMKEALDEDKMIRARVKEEMNEWLGKMCLRVAKDMNKSPYTMIEGGDLHRAIEKYEQLERVAEQKERIITALNRIIQDCKILVSDVERTFDVEEGMKRKNKPGKKLSESAKEEEEEKKEELEE